MAVSSEDRCRSCERTPIRDRTGAPIATLYDQYRLPVTYDGIAKTMDAAIIAIEDRRFFTEAGVDPRAVLRAAVNNSSGGSTTSCPSRTATSPTCATSRRSSTP